MAKINLLMTLCLIAVFKPIAIVGEDCSANYITPSNDYNRVVLACGTKCPVRGFTRFQQTEMLEEGEKVLLVSPHYGCKNYPRGNYTCRTEFENMSGGKIKYTLVKLDVRDDINTCNTRSDRLVFIDVAGPPTRTDKKTFCRDQMTAQMLTSLNSNSKVNFKVSPGGTAGGFEVLVEALPSTEGTNVV